jgi:SAM-dependent MidA family methyltransferase
LLSDQIRDAIAETGSISFSKFMEAALYHPTLGYYTRQDRSPFGVSGDFYTATQVQPVFGRLIARLMHQLGEERFFDWGAGAETMRPFFDDYTAIEVPSAQGAKRSVVRGVSSEVPSAQGARRSVVRGEDFEASRGAWPEHFRGFVFANELFDALPVDVFVRRGEEWFERRVIVKDDRFAWDEQQSASAAQREWLDRFGPQENFSLAEMNSSSKNMLATLASHMSSGWLLAIDYGLTRRELIRFPQGTLMSYRHHTASADVLDEPGDRDITSHVNFDALRSQASECGFREERFETLASLLLRIGEDDSFASALDAPEPMLTGLRMQLKTLLYGMGETFRAVLWKRDEPL